MSDSYHALLASSFTSLDWAIVVGYLLLTTLIGGVLAGKQSSIRDFFLGGKKLPWYAVSGSIIATEISALTFVGLPYVVFRPGGNFTYLQLGVFGSLLARLVVGYVLVPAYYKREIYSPYDYIGNRLGESARKVTTAFFALSGILAQSARVFLTAVVLELILADSLFGRLHELTGISTLSLAIWTIGLIAIFWTWMGGIATVIWTDVLLFLVFVAGAVISLVYIIGSLDGGWAELITVASAEGKFRFFDFNTSPAAQYTIWTAVIASTWHNVGAYGTDQLIAQRMFCCKNERQAKWAIISSYSGLAVTATVMLVGAGLYAYYQVHPLSTGSQAIFESQPDRIFPLFIIEVLPPGLTGLLIAGVFAAAISSLDSILAALSQTVLSAFYLPWLQRRKHGIDEEIDARHTVRVSRMLVFVWGIVLCLLAQLASIASTHYQSILDLGLAMAGFAGGSLIAGFLLAFLPLKIDGRGLCWSAPVSLLTVFALAWHQPWAQWTCVASAIVLALLWIAMETRIHASLFWRRTGWFGLSILIMLAVSQFGYASGPPSHTGDPTYHTVAWPWYSPVGCTIAFIFGYLLAGPVPESTIQNQD